MKTTINFYDFERAFVDANRSSNFSYEGKKALFDYLEEYEADSGEELELDIIALCCDFTEYENLEEFFSNYSDDYLVWDIDPEEADEEQEAVEGIIDYEATLDNIREFTMVIDIDGTSFIIQAF